MTSSEKSELLRELKFHIKEFRNHRRMVDLNALRMRAAREIDAENIGFHSLRIAEIMERLNGSTR